MITLENDYSNFAGMVENGKMQINAPILVDEITSIMVEGNSAYVDLLQQIGIEISDKPSHAELAEATTNNIGNNQKLIKLLSFKIAERNSLIPSTDVSEEDLKQVEYIVQEITPLANDIQANQESAEAFKEAIIVELSSKDETPQPQMNDEGIVQKAEETGNNKLKWILGAAAVIGIGFFIYKSRKKFAF